jgi:DNA polymerase gamma 1
MTAEGGGYTFYKLPHAHGESANVGNPLSKDFLKYALDGTLKSIGTIDKLAKGAEGEAMEVLVDGAKQALDMNAQCSYWISARDRILNQMVVWEKEHGEMGLGNIKVDVQEKWGMILPQVITMGTVTRRAIEKTWLTASNAKKNRVGSELKAMVRAPPGYAIVGADVDSEELWISSVMGDAQFGMHGATAIGWMTLEGTKQAGTDLHSKTASILGITRDAAKVFNYSRIYGAGMRHAVLLLLQANAGMSTTQAQKLAGNLYASTKGKNTNTTNFFGAKLWYGGSESFLFNRLEAIATSEKPMTPALGCGVTSALSKKHLPTDFGSDYLPSRINWVVQSSGVDYLHLLITATDYLLKEYKIDGRYMISVHDEVRYIVKEEDKYRAALALQIANLWTRSLFAFRLGLDDLPASVGFFSAVDIDFALRKEVHMECITPSQPDPLPPGEALDIQQLLPLTNYSLHPRGIAMEEWRNRTEEPPCDEGYIAPDCETHRALTPNHLKAQSTTRFNELKQQSDLYARRLKENGKEDEVKSWTQKNLNKYRERKALDHAMVVESLNLPDETPQLSLTEMAEAINA